MPNSALNRLRGIKTLPSLLAYLRDELDWPIDSDAVEDSYFEYDPSELGFDVETTVHIKEVKQLRPLHSGQPWGVFWVNFERKRLPVVMLRRALGHLVVKKRASANKADQRAWQMNDLLFISAYGEDHDRAVTFAHFSEDQEAPGGLAVGNVLGGVGAEGVLVVANAHRVFTEKLRWPEKPEDVSSWRQQWSSAFTLRHREVITTTDQLVEELAKLAKDIRKAVLFAVSRETDRGAWRKLLSAFQATLIRDLDEDAFADVIAQTISYGLLTARFSTSGTITLRNLVDMVPRTNPFLKELLRDFVSSAGRRRLFDVDEVGIGEVVILLNAANSEAIKNDFGNKTRGDDPIIYFYEHFLEAYNKEIKVMRGVFYTPQPVVSYIVRNVHELLQTEFGLADGLADTTTWGEMLKKHPGLKLPLLSDDPSEKRTISADEPFVQILDPATGTATFLVEVIEVIYGTLKAKWNQQHLTDAQQDAAWNDYVPKHLLPRLHAFELMMAPYAIAHMKIGLKLAETGYLFKLEQRARIYLTNALEPWQQNLSLPDFGVLAHETIAVNNIKREKRFTVVIGNPPYSNFGQLNRNPYILGLLDDYKKGLNETKLNLDDDFIKFFRFSQELIQRAGIGTLGLITNHTFVNGLTHRQMRNSLINTFPTLFIVNLHGSQIIPDAPPDGSIDQNVFAIRQGVAITIGIRPFAECPVKLWHQDFWGSRVTKYDRLLTERISLAKWVPVTPSAPSFFFEPRKIESIDEYQHFFSLRDIMPIGSSGIQTKRDELFIDKDKECLTARMREIIRAGVTRDMRKKYPLDTSPGWSPSVLKSALFSKDFIKPYLFRPFDKRWIYYDPDLLGRARYAVFSHLLHPNIALVSMRQTVDDSFYHVFCTQELCDINLLINHHVSDQVFPLYLYQTTTDLVEEAGSRRANISAAFIGAIEASSDLRWLADGKGDLKTTFGPEDALAYIYAILNTSGYRVRYWQALRTDFPRIPIPRTKLLFSELARIGHSLLHAHINVSTPSALAQWIGEIPSVPIDKIDFTDRCIWIDSSRRNGIANIDAQVWAYRIGGYRVCAKWLSGRKGQALTKEDVLMILQIIGAVENSLALTAHAERTVDKFSGWPEAFIKCNWNGKKSSRSKEGHNIEGSDA